MPEASSSMCLPATRCDCLRERAGPSPLRPRCMSKRCDLWQAPPAMHPTAGSLRLLGPGCETLRLH